MIVYVLTAMTLHCSLALPATRGTTGDARYDCSPSVSFLEFKGKTVDEAFHACEVQRGEIIRLMGKYSYRATTSCKRKESQ